MSSRDTVPGLRTRMSWRSPESRVLCHSSSSNARIEYRMQATRLLRLRIAESTSRPLYSQSLPRSQSATMAVKVIGSRSSTTSSSVDRGSHSRTCQAAREKGRLRYWRESAASSTRSTSGRSMIASGGLVPGLALAAGLMQPIIEQFLAQLTLAQLDRLCRSSNVVSGRAVVILDVPVLEVLNETILGVLERHLQERLHARDPCAGGQFVGLHFRHLVERQIIGLNDISRRVVKGPQDVTPQLPDVAA